MVLVRQVTAYDYSVTNQPVEIVQLNGCPLETDPYWNITWKPTLAGMIDTQRCPGGPYATG